MRTIITTDIHGCSLEFQALLKITGLDRTEDTLVVLGDLFDRGKRSYEVFKQVLRLRQDMEDRFVFVRGNHDQFLLDHVRDGEGMYLWSYNGGKKTIQSFEQHGGSLEEAAAFIEEAPYYYETEQFIGVHAGLKSDVLEENTPEIFLWDRSVAHGEYTGRLAIGGHTPMNEPVWFLPDGSYVTLPYDKKLPLPDRGFIILDTGCVFGGKLTAMILEGEEFELKCIRKRAY